MKFLQNRVAAHFIHPLIHSSGVLASMNGQPVDMEVLKSLFEAARWTASHMNCQNWRFVYVTPNHAQWKDYLATLDQAEDAQSWVRDAAVLMAIVSKASFKVKGVNMQDPARGFTAGSAWAAMALEGAARGLVMRPVTGRFNRADLSKVIGLPIDPKTQEYRIEALVAIGNKNAGDVDSELKVEEIPRTTIDQLISEGVFTKKRA